MVSYSNSVVKLKNLNLKKIKHCNINKIFFEQINLPRNLNRILLMLNLKEQTIKELDELKPQALAKVYDLITELKRINQAQKNKPIAADYIKVREALKQCKGSLSENIILEREDRI